MLDGSGLTVEIVQFWVILVVLVLSFVLAVVGVRRGADDIWRRIARAAAVALVVDFFLLLLWLASVSQGVSV